MDHSKSQEWALAFDAADRMYRNRSDGAFIRKEQLDFIESVGPDPNTLASLARITIGNLDNPIGSIVVAAERLNLNVGVVPPKALKKVTVFGTWIHDYPVLLIGEGKNIASFNHAVASEIGGLLLCKAAYIDGQKTHGLKKLMRNFADSFLYPDSAAYELRHMPSIRRLKEHSDDFAVSNATIFHRLRTVK